MKDIQNTKSDTKALRTPRNDHLSPDGKWRSFPKVPNLLQYVSTGTYYGRIKVDGKLARRSLDASTFEQAKLKLGDFLKKHREDPVVLGAAGAALKAYLRSLEASHEIGDSTKDYYRDCIRVLLKTWHGFRAEPLHKLTMEKVQGEAFRNDPAFIKVQVWATKVSSAKDAQYFNNILGRLKVVLEIGGISRDRNPAYKIKRVGIQREHPVLPSQEQFNAILKHAEASGAGQAQHCADLIRFLAYSGQRIGVATKATWNDASLNEQTGTGFIVFRKNKRQRGKNVSVTNEVPIIPEMAEFLLRLKKQGVKADEPICKVRECQKSLDRACKLAGAVRITHHDLRHLFASVCIENGVEVPTVAEWLGHSDRGALLLHTYKHLRKHHSAEMARRVSFSQAQPANVLPMPQEATA